MNWIISTLALLCTLQCLDHDARGFGSDLHPMVLPYYYRLRHRCCPNVAIAFCLRFDFKCSDAMLDTAPTRSFPLLLSLRLLPFKIPHILLFFAQLKGSNLISMTVLLQLFGRIILDKD